ncbi:hypothetical protein BGX24_010111 [Mortierella sp. AD032]|nr:hypothetical protein BGX24_010111 [Mortierella sp. AD032]
MTVTPKVLKKYGAYISHVVNTTTLEHVKALQHSKISLRSIKAFNTNVCQYRQIMLDTIRRNQGSLQSINISSKAPQPNTSDEQWYNACHFVSSLDAISSFLPSTSGAGISGLNSGLVLTMLSLSYVCMSRESFSSLLQHCSVLQSLVLHRVLLWGHGHSIALFAGSKLQCLVASLIQAWDLDPKDVSAPSLLAHFPQLEKWHIPSFVLPTNSSLITRSRDISKYCPSLRVIQFGQGDFTTASDLLANTFNGLESCILPARVLSASTVLALISHQNTLTSVSITGTAIEDNASTTQYSSTLDSLYMIPRLCPNLQVLCLKYIVIKVEDIEGIEWACKGLWKLRVRFKGLDSPQDIDACCKEVCTSKRRRGGPKVIHLRHVGDTISTPVHDHLLQFKQLRTLWLGTKDYYLPSHFET